jgi:hypothetical protein
MEMDSLYHGRKKTGYSLEDAYFHSENQRLISELRQKNATLESADRPEGVVIDATTRFEARRQNQEQNSTNTKKKAA